MPYLPKPLIDQIRRGQVVLFLGAGASYGAKMPDGSRPPTSEQLRDRIVEKFLGAGAGDSSLSWAAELATSATDLYTVQNFIADQFRDIVPSPQHYLLPTFKWRGIATTNYDRVVEIVYEKTAKPVQDLVSFLSNDDRVDQRIRDQNLILLKLHGCISRVTDSTLPLILNIDQYIKYREKRSRLFNMLEEWGSENTIVFVGHSLQDPDLRQLIQSLTENLSSRPRYYLVRPGAPAVERELWASKQITVLDSTFEDFIQSCDNSIDSRFRKLTSVLPAGHPVERRFVRRERPTDILIDFLTHYAEYVHDGMPYEATDPKQFYKGFGLGWYPIRQGLDVRRGLVERFLEDVVLRTEDDRPSRVELYVIRAEAGAGKSVLLRRIAWEAATEADVLCLWAISPSFDGLDALGELGVATDERIFLFIDDAADHVRDIERVITYARERSLRVTIVSAERLNEWNVGCEQLDRYLSESFPLRYLNEGEIATLVDLLEKNDAAGPNLENKTRDARIEEFVKRAGRQLLVALHEATQGLPFEEILLDEYEKVVPIEARRLYLSVCVLNRFGVLVRAGVISRVHEIPFEEFRTQLFAPLEHVVLTSRLPWGDYAYQARHPEIAQIVFDRVLTKPADRFNECIRLIKALNPIYNVDLEAIRGLTRGKLVRELFPNEDDARELYTAAEAVLGSDVYLLQQRANYERLRPAGDLRLAQSLLEEARKLDSTDDTVVHTLAEVLRARAEDATQRVGRIRLRGEARAALRSIGPGSRYATVTNLKIVVDELRDLLEEEKSSDRVLDDAIRAADNVIQSATQEYPGDGYVLALEADFARLLDDHHRVLEVLRRARSANPRDPYIAARLAGLLVRRGETDEARQCLEEAMDSNYGDKRLTHQYAEFLHKTGTTDADQLAYYYRRAFSKGDSNYESQFWFARFGFESANPDTVRESKEVFRNLREVPASHDERVKIRDVVGGKKEAVRFRGNIVRVEAAHGFISVEGRDDWIFFHRSDVEQQWDRLRTGSRVTFSVGFSLRGSRAIDLRFE